MDLLYKVKRGLWVGLRELAHEWTARGALLPADVIGPFNRTQKNALSVYALDGELATPARILAAIGARSQDGLVDTDCLIFTSDLVDKLGISREKTPGATLDAGANAWHWDLAHLTANQVVALAQALVDGAEIEPVFTQELVDALRQAVAAGDVTIEKLSGKVRKQAAL